MQVKQKQKINGAGRVVKSFTLDVDLDKIWSQMLLVNKTTFIRYALEKAVNDEAVSNIFFNRNKEQVRKILFNSNSNFNSNNIATTDEVIENSNNHNNDEISKSGNSKNRKIKLD